MSFLALMVGEMLDSFYGLPSAIAVPEKQARGYDSMGLTPA